MIHLPFFPIISCPEKYFNSPYKSKADNIQFSCFFKKSLTNAVLCGIIHTISYEEDKQRVANVYREPADGASR